MNITIISFILLSIFTTNEIKVVNNMNEYYKYISTMGINESYTREILLKNGFVEEYDNEFIKRNIKLSEALVIICMNVDELMMQPSSSGSPYYIIIKNNDGSYTSIKFHNWKPKKYNDICSTNELVDLCINKKISENYLLNK